MPYTVFLDANGEMGSLIRDHDWSASPLGAPESWPQSLLTTLSIVLHSRFPIVILWGPQYIVLYNDAYAEALKPQGKHPRSLGRPANEVWPTRWEQELQPNLQRAEAGETVYTEDQLVITNRNGGIEDVYWTVNYAQIKGEAGKTVGVLITCVDTTQRVQHLRQAQDSERKFRSNVKQAPIGIVIFRGPEFEVEVANDTYLSIVDKTEAQLVNKPFFDVLPEIRQPIEPLLSGVLTTGVPYEGQEFPVKLHRHGREELTFFNFIYQPLHEDDGRISGIMVVAMEVTEMAVARHELIDAERLARGSMQMLEQKVRERTSDLERANQLLERSNEDLQQFAHVASHDLKEPVRKITIYGQRLEEEFGETLGLRGSQYLTRMLQSTRRMFDMIDGILRYSSLQGLEQPMTTIDLNKVIRNITTDLELLIHEKHASITYTDLPLIRGMPDLVHQLWYNLINNSLKFSRPGVPPEIVIHGASSRGVIGLTLKDNGIGFPNDKAVLIFETFRRLNSKDAYEGTGLGLALCKKIVERHHGTITASGEPYKGAEFVIRWPA